MTAAQHPRETALYRALTPILAVCLALAASQLAADPDKHARHDHDAKADVEDDHDGGHEHGGEEALSMSLEEISRKRCEHEIEAYLCKECRYEVGVVKVSAALLKKGQANAGLIATGKATRRKLTSVLQATGEIRLNGNTTVHVTPRIPGVIKTVAVDLGDRVVEGDTLFTVHSTELGKSLADHERSQALAALSRQTYEREKQLFDQKVCSEQDMIEAKMIHEQHRTDLVAAEQALHVLGLTEEDVAAAGTRHGTDIGVLPVRASRSGVILERHAVAGELAEPGADVMLLVDLETLWVWIDIYERDLGLLVQGGKSQAIQIEVSVNAFPNRVFPGVIDYVGAVMDQRTRTVKTRALVENTDGLLRPGMFCDVGILAGESEDALVVPESAVLEDEGTHFVFKAWKDEYFVQRPVTPGRRSQGVVEILGGLDEGEVVATEGAFLLKSDVLREKMGAGCAD